ncbi:MAG: DUF4417 domain-containing protein [Actinomycetota bacterium]|nr:DUF4417 domain-containing protein [Actinomycetota bacterium]
MAKSFNKTKRAIRRGIVDVWNAFMVEGASYDTHDIPICPTTAEVLPKQLISWPEAKRLHRKALRQGDKNYHVDAFIHFYVDDVKFDGVRSSIWLFPWRALEIIEHFDGIITPDFSMCQDFPEPIKLFAVYRMRAFGYWIGRRCIAVINNVRWGTRETWKYCFAGIPHRTAVAIGVLASGLRKLENRPLFEDGLAEMVKVLRPTVIVVYGSANYECLKQLETLGVEVLQFDSETSCAFERRSADE